MLVEEELRSILMKKNSINLRIKYKIKYTKLLYIISKN